MQNSQKNKKISAQKRRIQNKKRKRNKIIASLLGTVAAVAVLAGAVFLTIELVSGDKLVLDTSQSIQTEETLNENENVVEDTSNEDALNEDTTEEILSLNEEEAKEEDNIPQPNEFSILVDVNNPLPSDFAPDVREILDTGKLFDTRAADDLERLLNDAAAAGYPMYLVSTYRTVEYQEGLYNRKVNEYINSGYSEEDAKTEAAKWVAIPGTSEHNLGLAADIVSSTWYNTNSDLTQEFENTEHFTWLKENAANYGFMISFPKGKESITGIVYEPWHYRYVGTEIASYLMENNMCLQEYYDLIQ